MTAMSYSDACDGLEVHDAEFCESVELVSKLVYEQAHCLGGGDAVWRNPRDGTFHHPSFPENQGRAYETVHQSRKDWTRVMLVEWVTTVMVERHPNAGCKPEEHQELHEYYEHWCQDILESEGELGLIRTLVACA
ncbi:MAG: hypothetical protein R3242_06805 [Akkermansiaceae bacterium]|nr:hypothetical protein [Akkermansiaceae bacterium]